MKKYKLWGIHISVVILLVIIIMNLVGMQEHVTAMAFILLLLLVLISLFERRHNNKALLITQSLDAIGDYYPRIAKIVPQTGECIFIRDREKVVPKLFTAYSWEEFRKDFLKGICPEDVEKCRAFTSLDNLLRIGDRQEGSDTCIYRRTYMGGYQWVQIVVLAIKDEPGAVLAYAKLLDESLKAGEMQKVRLFELLQQAKQAEQERREFMRYYQTVLSAPAEALDGILTMAIEDCKAGNMQEADRHVTTIKTLAEYLKILISDIDQVGVRGEAIFVEKKTAFSLKTVVKGCEDFYGKINLPERNITFRAHTDENLAEGYLGDKYRLIQVLDAILSNAFRFNRDNGSVDLSLKIIASDETSDTVRFEVADTGCGISEEFKNSLFDIFAREGNEREGMREGTGIGLYLGKKAIDSMHGEVCVSSVPGEGSIFAFTLTFERLQQTLA